MTKVRKKLVYIIVIVAALVLLAACSLLLLPTAPWGFARPVSDEEAALRLELVETAQTWLGCSEEDGAHRPIIDLYNSHAPLAQGYEVQYTDSWCSTFASAAAIRCGLTQIIPTECGCERHIGLFMEMGCWEESDTYMPLPGDYIFYVWDDFTLGDASGWADHVGIVTGTFGPFIRVIEGNRNDRVEYRYILRGDLSIRGFGLPDYASLCK